MTKDVQISSEIREVTDLTVPNNVTPLPRRALLSRRDVPVPSDKTLSRDVMAKALAEHERLDVGWQCYLGAVDAVLIALRQEGFSVTRDSTNSRE